MRSALPRSNAWHEDNGERGTSGQRPTSVIAGRLLRVTGRIERDGTVVHLVAEQIEDLSPRLATIGQQLKIGTETERGGETVRPIRTEGRAVARHPREQARKLFPSRDFH